MPPDPTALASALLAGTVLACRVAAAVLVAGLALAVLVGFLWIMAAPTSAMVIIR